MSLCQLNEKVPIKCSTQGAAQWETPGGVTSPLMVTSGRHRPPPFRVQDTEQPSIEADPFCATLFHIEDRPSPQSKQFLGPIHSKFKLEARQMSIFQACKDSVLLRMH